jgi:hypothetical protein
MLSNARTDELAAGGKPLLPGVSDARVEIVFDPPWDSCKMSDAAKLQLGLL